MTYNRPILFLASIGLLLLVPLIAMQFSSAVDWSLMDFGLAAVLLGALGAGIELVFRLTKQTARRLRWIVAIVLLFLLVWAELAVGILGTPFAGS